jgi:hypothetical protein
MDQDLLCCVSSQREIPICTKPPHSHLTPRKWMNLSLCLFCNSQGISLRLLSSGIEVLLTFSISQQMATLRFVQVAYILMAFVVVLGDVLGLVSFYMHPLGCSSSAETGMTPFSRLRFTSLESRDGRTGDSISTPGISKFELLFHAEGAGRPLSVPHIVNRSWTEGASMYIALDGPKIPSCPAAWYFVTASSNGTQADDPVFARCPAPENMHTQRAPQSFPDTTLHFFNGSKKGG